MKTKIRIGICGYGNLGCGVESEIGKSPDMELTAVFTRRKPASTLKIKSNVPVIHTDDAELWKDKIDVLILCGGSATDLPEQGPVFSRMFNTVDSFDTHAKIPEYLAGVDASARAGGNLSIVSIGWDPGLFSLLRLYTESVLPEGRTYTFWGKGVSQGHSDAVRRIEGVLDAIQYTVPKDSALEKIRASDATELSTREKHERVCYVVAKDGADKARIERQIKQMPNYFDEYDTFVHFISADEMEKNHRKLPHGGKVIRMGRTGDGNRHALEFAIKLDSNPEFTASVLLAYARAAYRLSQKGETGAKTIYDIPPVLLFPGEPDEAIKKLL